MVWYGAPPTSWPGPQSVPTTRWWQLDRTPADLCVLLTVYCQIDWQSPVLRVSLRLRLSPFRLCVFGDGFRFHRRQRER
jgi:hypothetical protein